MAGKRIVIVGSGLSGGLLACTLARRGHDVTMYERRPDPRRAGFIGGRSINLALSCRGVTALQRFGLADAVLADAIPMRGRLMHDTSGTLTYQAYSKNAEDVIHSVSRGKLNMTLMDAAESSGAKIVFGHRCVDADLDAPAAMLRDEESHDVEQIECDALFGADGAFSAVRGRMQRTDRFDYSQDYLPHGYKELTIPPAESCGVDPAKHDGFAMEPKALHIWPRGGSMMIALPNADKSFTCTLFWPFEGAMGFDRIATRSDIMPFFQEHYGDAVPLIPQLVDDYVTNPIGSLATIRCWPWHAGGRVLILGDASHAIVPFYGQGINSGFEDCRVFDELLDEHAGDFATVFPQFSRVRKPNADAIADLALDNFVVMRDSVAHPEFLARKRVEHALHAVDAERFTPLYNLVSFSNTPYSEAREIGERVIAVADSIVHRIGVEATKTMPDEALLAKVRAFAEDAG